MVTLFADVETDGFLDEMTCIWCLAVSDAESDGVDLYTEDNMEEGLARLAAADVTIWHNGLGFDLFAINKVYPGTLDPSKVADTLVISRLFLPERRKASLEEWGRDLGFHKWEHQDFSVYTEEMGAYCQQDVRVTKKLYQHFMELNDRWFREKGMRFSDQSIRLEHQVRYIVALQEQNGFALNVPKAEDLAGKLRQEQEDIERELQLIFPPIWVPSGKEEFVPKRDNAAQGYLKGTPLTKVELQAFNPGSRQQIVRRFQRKYNWKPKSFTPSGAPQIDEAVLDAMKYPEAEPLRRYFRVAKLLGQIADGDNGWLKLVKGGRVYGAVNTNGAPTGRMSHFKPNMAQVDKKDLRMREVWEPRSGWKLVGIDADGLELRTLAHYLARYDGGKYAKAVVLGKKEDETDAHSLTRKAVGLFLRDDAKTYIYALIYGAGDLKLGSIIVEDAMLAEKPRPKVPLRKLGRESRQKIMRGITGLGKLTDAVKSKAKSAGMIKGIDGRIIHIRSDHSALNFLLQGCGAVIMKQALVNLFESLTVHGLVHGEDYAFVVNVHDEWQIECQPEYAASIGALGSAAITRAGEQLGLRCPMAGSYDVGDNWKETH